MLPALPPPPTICPTQIAEENGCGAVHIKARRLTEEELAEHTEPGAEWVENQVVEAWFIKKLNQKFLGGGEGKA